MSFLDSMETDQPTPSDAVIIKKLMKKNNKLKHRFKQRERSRKKQINYLIRSIKYKNKEIKILEQENEEIYLELMFSWVVSPILEES
jgi:hypothetical protein